jgi:hypothetical protein
MTSNESFNIDIEQLKVLYKENPVAKAALKHFASRERNRGLITVETLQAKLNQGEQRFQKGEIIGFFKSLEELKCGRFIAGRRGHSSRFQWNESTGMATIGKIAAGDVNPTKELDDLNDLEDTALTHSYNLRPNFIINLELPKNITHTEANRLASFIKTLPFEGSNKQAED